MTAIASWGEANMRKIAGVVTHDFGEGIEVWRTEYNLKEKSPDFTIASKIDGAIHGIYWASYVLSGIEHFDKKMQLRVLCIHIFLT